MSRRKGQDGSATGGAEKGEGGRGDDVAAQYLNAEGEGEGEGEMALISN